MQRMIPLLTVLICLLFLPVVPATAGWFGEDILVTIDGNKYSTEDFKRWWRYWNTDQQALPESPDFYVDWLLLSREGARMELDQDPGFKRQSRVFLQSRGLLRLKYEEVDSRIKITDEQIAERYRRDFVPRWQMLRLNFADEETASAVRAELAAGTLTLEQLLQRQGAEKGPVSTSEKWIYPRGTDPLWVERLGKAEIGTFIDAPDAQKKGTELHYLKEKKGEDAEELAARRERIESDLYKEQEGALTRALLQRLREKYQVQVNKERLAAIDLDGEDSSFTDNPVITTNRENVSEKQFIIIIRRLQANRPVAAHAAGDKEKAEKLKAETVDNIIAQALTDWEALDRHFEEQEPFRSEYLFNQNHRLTLALERRLFAGDAEVKDAQIEERYQRDLERYTRPAVATFYLIDETEGPVDRFWGDAATGKDFGRMLQDHFEQRITPQQVPVNHLDPEIRPVIEKLAKGETSPVFTAQGLRVIVHLQDLTPERPLPLEAVKKSIKSDLWQENLDRLRREYVEKLKTQSQIKVNLKHWKSLRKELGGV